jgi:hypothetical protein
MPERKPPGASWQSHIEQQIARAEAEGAFDRLPGAGRPIQGLDKPHDPDWWLRQLLQREGLSVTPVALALRKDVEDCLARVAHMEFESEVRITLRDLNARIRRSNATTTTGPGSDVTEVDTERFIAVWRASRQSE